MSGFGGRISFEGSTARGKQLLARAIKHANIQRQTKNLLKQTNSVRAYDLSGGAYCVVVDLGHMRAIHIVAPESGAVLDLIYEDEPPYRGYVGPGVYDVLSGYTQSSQIVKEKYTDEQNKTQTVEVIKQFKPTQRTNTRHPNDRYRRNRLAVKENPIFIPPNEEPGAEWSEHTHVKPSNYSGAMRRVVQLIMGLGKILRPTAEEEFKPPLKPLPPIGKGLISKLPQQMVSAFGLYGPNAGKFTPRVDFDFRWSKTNGITFDSEGVPWLIEIGSRGLIAMRLYLDPTSTTYEGANRWCQVSPELVDFMVEFGGIPLGIAIPTFELYDKYKRAGEAIELISERDMRVAYGKVPMSTDTGWTFSDKGQRAYNTCWDYALNQVKRGYMYSIGIRLQYERFKPWTPARSTLAGGFTTLYEVNKCRRMEEKEAERIIDIYARDGGEAGYKAFDESVVKPTLVGNASISLQRSGYLYHKSPFKGQPQFKFPEQLAGGLLSFDFTDASDPHIHRNNIFCDTPMYVVHINGGLEVVNYAYDSADHEAPPVEPEEPGECEIIGDWGTDAYDAGFVVVDGCFYSNRWDFRKQRRTGRTMTKRCVGYELDKQWFSGQTFIFSSTIMVWTEVGVFVECIQKDYGTDPNRMVSVTAIMNDRNAYAMAVEDTDYPPNNTLATGKAGSVRGEETEVWDVAIPIVAWVGSAAQYCPKPYSPLDQAPLDCIAHLRCKLIDPNACSSANVHTGKFYLNGCPPRPDAIPHPPMILPPGYSYNIPNEGTVDSYVHFVNDTTLGEKLVHESHVPWDPNVQEISIWWTRASPDDAGRVPHYYSVNSCLGEPVTNTMNDMDGDIIHFGLPESMWAAWTACYTGVIEVEKS